MKTKQDTYMASGQNTLFAVYDIAEDALLNAPEERSDIDGVTDEAGYFYVSLGVSAILKSEYPSLQSSLLSSVRVEYKAHLDGACHVPFFDTSDLITPIYFASGDGYFFIEFHGDESDSQPVCYGGNTQQEVGDISPWTHYEELARMARQIETLASSEGQVLFGALEALEEKRDELRDNSASWGELSPYLEALLESNHPHVRLKSTGKFNPEGKRIILLYVNSRAGEHGWEPAALEESDTSLYQWEAAGIPYPDELKKKAVIRKTRELLSDMKVIGNAHSDVMDCVAMLNAQQKEIQKQLAESQSAFRKEVASRLNTVLTRILASLSLSKALDASGKQRLLVEALCYVGESLRKLATLPYVALDETVLKELTHPETNQGALYNHIIQVQLANATALIALMKGIEEDDAIISVESQLSRIAEYVAKSA